MNKFVLGSLVLATSIFVGCGGGSTSCCDTPNSLVESGMTPPVAKITGLNDTTISIGQKLTGEALASYDRDEDGKVVGYKWSVNGKEVSTNRSTSFTFNVSGTHKVCLTVTDNDGLDSVNEECKVVTVLGKVSTRAVAPTAVINLSGLNLDGTLTPCSVDHIKHSYDCNQSHDNDTLGTGKEIQSCMWDVKSYKLDSNGNEVLYRDCTKIVKDDANHEFCVCDAATKIVANLTVVDNDGQTATTTKTYIIKH